MNTGLAVICQYCGGDATLVTGRDIYPHRDDLSHLKFWECKDCHAYVGTHVNSPTHKPKGCLANAALRLAKVQAHQAFDVLWQEKGMTRAQAYGWLQEALNMNKPPHIGYMDEEQCDRVVAEVSGLLLVIGDQNEA